MANATNTLQATIISADQNGAISINRGLGNPALAGNVGSLTINVLLAAGANTIVFSTGTYYQLYVKNNAAVGSGLNLTVNYTPVDGAAQQSPVLAPGGVFIIWQIENTITATGFSTLSFTASAPLLVEYFIGN